VRKRIRDDGAGQQGADDDEEASVSENVAQEVLDQNRRGDEVGEHRGQGEAENEEQASHDFSLERRSGPSIASGASAVVYAMEGQYWRQRQENRFKTPEQLAARRIVACMLTARKSTVPRLDHPPFRSQWFGQVS
jgi:hypothetical protein